MKATSLDRREQLQKERDSLVSKIMSLNPPSGAKERLEAIETEFAGMDKADTPSLAKTVVGGGTTGKVSNEPGALPESESNRQESNVRGQTGSANSNLGTKSKAETKGEEKGHRTLQKLINQVRQEISKVLGNEGNEDLVEFTRRFYTRLSEHNALNGKTELFSVSREERRYDALARLLEINSKDCTAVCFDGESILLATNNNYTDCLDKENPTFDSDLFLLQRKVKLLAAHMTAIADHIHNLRKAGHEVTPYHDDIASKRKSFLYAALPSVAQFKDKELAIAMTIVEDFCEYEKSAVSSTPETVNDWWESYKKDKDFTKLGIKEEKAKLVKRYLKDLVKVEEFIATINEQGPLFQNLLSTNKKRVFNIVYDGGAHTHAEIRLMVRLKSNITDLLIDFPRIYIGISKLCCAHCNLVVQNFRGIEQIHEEEDQWDEAGHRVTRGYHGNGYVWSLHESLKNNEEFLKAFLGDNDDPSKSLYKLFDSLTGKVQVVKAKPAVVKKVFGYTLEKQGSRLNISALGEAPGNMTCNPKLFS